jgi:hypothetical protein
VGMFVAAAGELDAETNLKWSDLCNILLLRVLDFADQVMRLVLLQSSFWFLTGL